MLAQRMAQHKVDCWLVNTGWTGGKFGHQNGRRCPLKYTRAIVDAIHSGELAESMAAEGGTETYGVFNLSIPTNVSIVPREILNPKLAWKDKEAFDREVRKLAVMFGRAFAVYEVDVDKAVAAAGPQV